MYLADTTIPSSEKGKSNIVIVFGEFLNTINYIFNCYCTNPKVNRTCGGTVVTERVTSVQPVLYIISSPSNKKYVSTGCKSLSSRDISIVESQCVADHFVNMSKCSNCVDFTDASFVPLILI